MLKGKNFQLDISFNIPFINCAGTVSDGYESACLDFIYRECQFVRLEKGYVSKKLRDSVGYDFYYHCVYKYYTSDETVKEYCVNLFCNRFLTDEIFKNIAMFAHLCEMSCEPILFFGSYLDDLLYNIFGS